MNALLILVSGLVLLPVATATPVVASTVQNADSAPSKKQEEIERLRAEKRARAEERRRKEEKKEKEEAGGSGGAGGTQPRGSGSSEPGTATKMETGGAQTERERELEARVKTLEKKLETKEEPKLPKTEEEIRAVLLHSEIRHDSSAAAGITVWTFGEKGVLAGRTVDTAGIDLTGDGLADTGAWRVDKQQVCVVWSDWYEGDERCYSFQKMGRNFFLARTGESYKVLNFATSQ